MSYVPIVLPADLKTNIYPNTLNEITQGDDTIASQCINEAVDEVRAYISRFDTVALLGDPAAGTSATTPNEYLKAMVKTVAVWKFVNLSNPGIDYEKAKTMYESTIKTLTLILQSKMTPPGWPFVAASDDPVVGAPIIATGNKKRRNRI